MSEAKRTISRAVQKAFLGSAARSRRVIVSWAAAGGITARSPDRPIVQGRSAAIRTTTAAVKSSLTPPQSA